MIEKISHIGIAVNSIEEAARLYTDVLGLKISDIEVIEDRKAKIAMIPVGESNIELVEPTDPEGAIAKHIEREGEGLHHIALEVSNIEEALETLKKQGVALLDEKPTIGAGGHKIAFLHPKSTKVLIELTELRK